MKLTVLYLQALYPGLRIVGASHPHIHVEGEQLENAEERDALLIEQINYAAPDLLFLNLGNPKQELWFERVRKKLHVPVTIGVGGAFDMLTGTVSRAPLWMQRVGLEWLFRLFQEPRRLFKRYVVDAFKFPSIALPLVLFHNFNRWRHQLRHWGREKNLALPNPLLFISTHQTITVVPLPTRIDKLVSLEIKDASDDFFNQDVIVLDFQHVGHLDLEGLGLLLYLWERAAKEKKQLFALGVKRNIHKLLSLHRLLDCMRPYMCPTTQDIMARLIPNGHSSGVYDSIQQQHNHVIISFFGCLDNRQDYTVYIKKIAPILHKKTCILDLTYCSYIDNTGIAFLLMLHKIQPDHFVSLKIAGMSKIIRKQLRMAGVLSFFG